MAQSSTSPKPLIESDRVEGTAVYHLGGERIGTIKRLMIEKVSGQVVYAMIAFERSSNHGADLPPPGASSHTTLPRRLPDGCHRT